MDLVSRFVSASIDDQVSGSVFYAYNQCFGFGPGFAWIRIEFDGLDRIPDWQKGHTQKNKKSEEVYSFEVLDVLC
jgi:hypothetical protein